MRSSAICSDLPGCRSAVTVAPGKRHIDFVEGLDLACAVHVDLRSIGDLNGDVQIERGHQSSLSSAITWSARPVLTTYICRPSGSTTGQHVSIGEPIERTLQHVGGRMFGLGRHPPPGHSLECVGGVGVRVHVTSNRARKPIDHLVVRRGEL